MNSYALLFYIRKSKKRKDGKAPIYARITMNSNKTEFSTGEYVKPELWESRTNRVSKKSNESQSVNAHLNYLENKIKQVRNTLQQKKEQVTPVSIKENLSEKNRPELMFLQRFQSHLNRIEELIGVDYARGTFVKYRSAYRHFRNFLKSHYNKSDILITLIGEDMIREFSDFLKSVRDCNQNTTTKYLFVIKNQTDTAFKKGIINIDPFDDWNMKYKPTKPTHLTWDELQRIEGKEFDSDSLGRVRDVFVFSCYTGLAFSDLEKLNYNDFYRDRDGELWLSQNRTKTDEPAHILMLPKPKEIYEKYKDFEGTAWINEDRVLPTISNTKTNEYLKVIADVCRIKKRLTTHVGRHTFATTITLNNGVSIDSVQKMMGHSTRRQTEHYARIANHRIGEEMRNVKGRLENETA